jgi:hypothetical protein
MKNKTRGVLFFFLFLIFLLLGPGLVLYSFGYRLDLKNRKITQTGGLFIKTIPKQVEIYLNGKFKKKTDPFWGSALIENLLPGRYQITVKKEGYFPWEKELEIEKGKVTEVRSLVLFPQNLNFYPVLKKIDDFWLSPNKKEIILKEEEEGKWVLKIYSLEKKVKSYLLGEKDFSKGEIKFLNLNFSTSSDQLEIEVEIGGKISNFLLDLRKIPPQLRELEKEKIPENVLCYKEINGSFYFFDSSGYLFRGNSAFEKIEKLNEEPQKEKGKCNLKILGSSIFLEMEKNLYFLNSEEKKIEKILEGLKGMEVSPNFKKIALFSENEIWILNFDGKKEFLSRFSEKIGDLFWLNEDYLIFLRGNKIKVSEIDKRDKLNIYDLVDFEGERFFFDPSDQRIYLFREKTIFQSDPIL